jgi:transcriptional regulator with XRE-family HTH domain
MRTLPIDQKIRQLISASPLSIKDIADGAGVNYKTLWRFAEGRTPTINAVSAELLFHFFNGRTFSEPGKPLRRAPFIVRRGEGKAA